MMMKVIMQVQLRNQYIINQSSIKKKMIRNREILHQRKRQSSRHHNLESLIMKAKYFCILAYKHETDYKGLSHKQKMWPLRAIHRRTNQPGLTEGRACSRALEVLQAIDPYKMVVCWFI